MLSCGCLIFRRKGCVADRFAPRIFGLEAAFRNTPQSTLNMFRDGPTDPPSTPPRHTRISTSLLLSKVLSKSKKNLQNQGIRELEGIQEAYIKISGRLLQKESTGSLYRNERKHNWASLSLKCQNCVSSSPARRCQYCGFNQNNFSAHDLAMGRPYQSAHVIGGGHYATSE